MKVLGLEIGDVEGKLNLVVKEDTMEKFQHSQTISLIMMQMLVIFSRVSLIIKRDFPVF